MTFKLVLYCRVVGEPQPSSIAGLPHRPALNPSSIVTFNLAIVVPGASQWQGEFRFQHTAYLVAGGPKANGILLLNA